MPATADRLRFFSDVPDFTGYAFPDAPPDDGVEIEQKPPRSRVQVAKTGTFKHPIYGKFTITRATFDSMVANFRAGVPTDRLPVDFDHEPDYGGSSEACGWITDLTQDGGALYATVEWLWRGAFAIREGSYRYVSPTWSLAYVDEAGDKKGPTLLAFGLTNRPYFTMPAVSLSASFSRDELALCEEIDDADPADADRPIVAGEMTDFAKFAKVFGLAAEATEDEILAKAGEIVTASGVSLEERAKAEGKVLLAKADHDTLTADAKVGTEAFARVEALEKDAADSRFNHAFDSALTDPKGARVAPAEKDELRELFDTSEDAFTKVLKLRQPIVNGTAQGARGAEISADKREFATDGIDVDESGLEVEAKTQAYLRDHAGADYAETYIRFAEEAAA